MNEPGDAMLKNGILLTLVLALASPMTSAERPHGPRAIEVPVSVGTTDGQMKFVPDTLTFERGKYYKLVLDNPSDDEHYFTSDAFSTHVFTRKVEVIDAGGNTVVEIHGAVHDIELKPGSRVEWFFFPMTKGQGLKLYCHKKGHEAGGMVGQINIVGDL